MVRAEFLRSIDVVADVALPERLAHYAPTSKSLALLGAVLGEGEPATMAIAPYGSGKSLAAAVGAAFVANAPEHEGTLQGLRDRIEAAAPELGAALAERMASGPGRVLVLTGHVEDPAAALAAAGGIRRRDTLRETLAAIEARARKHGEGRIAILWDEFGRHLEALVVAGRSAELHAVQEIAEWASRAEEPRATFTVLLHQTLTNYASGLGQSGRAAWRKVEGRFSVLRFVEDSREMYELLGRVAGDGRSAPANAAEVEAYLAVARRAIAAGWFEAFPDAEALAPVLHASRRLAPAALHLLPLLSARLAQNERTVFGFLHGLGDEVAGLGALYRHFGEAMRTDTGLGGTHRRWIETESALARAEDDVEREALRAACLLQLGVGGERRRLRRGALIEAVAGGGAMEDGASAAVDRLLERKLFLHRLRNDDVSIWHGVDLDVEGRLAEARPRLLATIDVPAALEAAMPAPFGRPLRHNAQKAIGRFFEGRYVDAAALAKAGTAHSAVASATRDGRILYALAGSRDAIEALRDLARGDLAGRDDLVLVVPKDPLDIADVLAEVAALAEMRRDPELLGEDPLVGQEIDELAAVAHEQLGRMVERLTDPARGACAWWAAGEDLGVDAGVPVGEALSRLADRRFPKTPRLRNEQLVRRTVSRVMVNARKRALIGILERDDTPSFGLAGASTPDASICRTLLEATGLHAQHPDGRRWSEPEAVADEMGGALHAAGNLVQRVSL